MTNTYLKELQNGLSDALGGSQKVIIFGEDVLDPYGGAFKVTSGLSTKFPNQVFTTPISEAAIVGVGTGMALRGYTAIVEIMFGDFLTLCADQIINHACKFPLMYENVECPLIIRTPMGGGRGYGPTHSQSLEKMFLGCPGLKVIAPSHFHNPRTTLNHIVSSEKTPILFLENKMLYGSTLFSDSITLNSNIIVDEYGYEIAVIRNYEQGMPDVFVISYGGCSLLIQEVLTELANEEIRIDAIFPECIDPFPKKILETLCGVERLVVVEEGCDDFSWGAGVASFIYQSQWKSFKAPIKVIASDRGILPTSFTQEAAVLINKEKIESAILEVLSWD